MDWRGRRTSGNLEDRRGRGGGAMRMGGIGGAGAVVVLLIGMFLGVDVTPLLQGGGGSVVSERPSGPNVIDDETEEFVGVTLAETEEVWGALFASSNLAYQDPRLALFEGATSSGCGAAQSAMGPFYCPNDQTIYLDADFFRLMSQRFGQSGDFARAYVIAHEVAHHVQGELGTLGQVNQARARMSAREANALSVRVELQADCYAGIWAHAVQDRLNLTDQDIRDALATAAAIGDDALQQAGRGVVVPDSFTHGTSEQRQTWFHKGFRTGAPEACDTFSAQGL